MRTVSSFADGMAAALMLLVPLALLASQVRGQEMVPSFAKLAPIAPWPALLAAGQANHIPVEGIDPPGEAGSVSPGDSVTGLITLFEKAGRRRQWLLYLEMAGTNIIVKPDKPRMPLTW